MGEQAFGIPRRGFIGELSLAALIIGLGSGAHNMFNAIGERLDGIEKLLNDIRDAQQD